MCGILGMAVKANHTISKPYVVTALHELMNRATERGREAGGLAVRLPDRIEYYRTSLSAGDMQRDPAYQRFEQAFLDMLFAADGTSNGLPFAIVGHSRLVTNGIETVDANNQPVPAEHVVGVHNGIIVNDGQLKAAYGGMPCRSSLDSEVIYRALDRQLESTRSHRRALERVFAEIQGSASLVFLGQGELGLGLATNTGSLYVLQAAAAGIVLAASEGHMLRELARNPRLTPLFASCPVRQVRPGEIVLVDWETARPVPDIAFAAPSREVPHVAKLPQTVAFLDRAAQVANLRRCTRCILPETFPFIEFDAQGVCSVCRTHASLPPTLKGRAALEAAVAPYRKTTGEPDCLVLFSGGRDSSYILHYMRRELGMHPIALTYDWGMVSALARRNQARLVGKLGVEHVIRSPDIRRKRHHIRLNLQAWMHRPTLGLIPLFSAGDKGYYRYGRLLRRDTGVNLTVQGAGNPLEMTGFKTGFCGVREGQHGAVLYAYPAVEKLRFFLFYAKEYLLNPRYINRSLLDTLRSYLYTYVYKDDALYPFHYIPWDERVIMDVLVGEYGWEVDGETQTTWRIDDAFTPFHNYIYYTVAGFSEHDTYRSNQIRAGLIDRTTALRLAEDDNRPRLQAMREYASMIGMNLEEMMLAVNRIPKLYG